MKIDALVAGLLYGSLIGIGSWCISILLRKLPWPLWILDTLLVAFAFLLFVVLEIPFRIAARNEWFEIINQGHAGSNLIFPAMMISFFCIVGVAINLAFKVNARKGLHNDADVATK